MVLQNCSELKCLNLSYCKKLSQEGFAALVDNIAHLEKLDVSFTAVCICLPVYQFFDNFVIHPEVSIMCLCMKFLKITDIFILNQLFF